MTDDCKVKTVMDLVFEVMSNKKLYPKGLYTVIETGDFEGNYTHQKHELQSDKGKVRLAYEMHDGWKQQLKRNGGSCL